MQAVLVLALSIFRTLFQAGDTSNDLDYLSANALVLNGGSIKK